MPTLRKLRWYYARLRTMSAGELLFRCRRALGGALARWRERHPRPYSYYLTAAAGPVDLPASTHLAIGRVRARLGVPDALTARRPLEEGCPGAIQATLATARRILDGDLAFFDQTWHYGPEWRWHRDPRGDDAWPLRHWTRVDIRRGGAKYVWEPNRHQHLIALGKAWYWTHDPAFGAELERQFRGWLAQNPPYYGVHWTSAIELSVRLISWYWALAFAGESPELTEATRRQLPAAIALQAAHIRAHLSAYSSANNHLIAEAAALAITGMLFPELPVAQDWRATGLAMLSRELERQVFPDGVNAEQALHYHGEVLEWYLVVAAVERRQGGTTHRAWRDRLQSMALFLAEVGDDALNVPEYGDSDDARVAPLTELPNDYYQTLRAITAILLDDARVLRGDEPPAESAFWLCGRLGLAPDMAPLPLPRQLSVFPDGGWVIQRVRERGQARGSAQLAFNCGSLGYGALAAHGHADALSIWLSVDGVPLLIDPGTGTYHEDAQVRRYFRSTRAHNTIEIDDQDQSAQAGPTIWHAHAPVLLQTADLPPNALARGLHLGYRRLHDPVTHERTIYWCEPNAYAVVDRLSGAARHEVRQHWHLLPGACATVEPEHSCLVALRGAQLRLWFRSPAEMRMSVIEGRPEPMLGWYSPAYGRYGPSPTLCLHGTAGLPLALLTIIDLDLDDPITSIACDQHLQSISLRRGSHDYTHCLSPESPAHHRQG